MIKRVIELRLFKMASVFVGAKYAARQWLDNVVD